MNRKKHTPPPIRIQAKTHQGWFKVEEQAIRMIEEAYDRPDVCRKAKLAYFTACRVSNLRGCQSFIKSGADWARDMNLSYPHAVEGLRLLVKLGLLKIEKQKVLGTKMDAPSRYTVLPLKQENSTAITSNSTGIT